MVGVGGGSSNMIFPLSTTSRECDMLREEDVGLSMEDFYEYLEFEEDEGNNAVNALTSGGSGGVEENGQEYYDDDFDFLMANGGYSKGNSLFHDETRGGNDWNHQTNALQVSLFFFAFLLSFLLPSFLPSFLSSFS
jgi:hypothetical protein